MSIRTSSAPVPVSAAPSLAPLSTPEATQAPSTSSSSPTDSFAAGPASTRESAPAAVPPLQPGDLLKMFADKDLSHPQFSSTELAQLGQLACTQRDTFNAAWSGPALTRKYNQFLRHPTDAMNLAVNQLVANNMPSELGADFDIASVKDPEIAKAIRSITFLRMAEARGDTYFAGTDKDHTDWDGSLMGEFPVPAKKAIHDQTQLAEAALLELQGHLATIDPSQLPQNLQNALPQLQNTLKSLSTGAATSFGYGGMEFNGFNTATAFLADLMFGGTDGVYDPSSEKFLADAVSLLLSPDLTRLNKGTWQTALNYRLPEIGSFAPGLFGDPSTSATTKWLELLPAMVQQYYANDPRLQQDGYGPGDDVSDIYPSWAADANPASPADPKLKTLGAFETQFKSFDAGLLGEYKAAAHQMIATVLPSLTADQAQTVNDAIDGVTAEGAMTATILAALPADAAAHLQEVLSGDAADSLGVIGGPSMTADEARQKFTDQVWTPLTAYYRNWQQTTMPNAPVPQGYASWDDFWTKFMDPANFTVDVGSDTIATDSNGITSYSLQSPSGVDTLIKDAVHENTHRLQDLTGIGSSLLGAQVEGQALEQELGMGRDAVNYIRGTLESDPAKAAAGKYATFDRDVEVNTRTFATLATLDPKTRAHAESYIRNTLAPKLGITDPGKVDTLVYRGFDGAYSLNYPGGFLEQHDKNLQIAQAAQVDPSQVTPYTLLLSGISPNDSVADSVTKLRAGLGLPAL